MTKQELHIALNSGRLSKNAIDPLVHTLKKHPKLVCTLLDEIAEEDKNGTFNASWVFDHLMRKKLEYLLPYIEEFTTTIKNLHSESCIRPMAHVCEMLCIAYFKKKKTDFVEKIEKHHLEQITECCFDWLIGNHKIAAKVFAMTNLFYLGELFDWVRPELKLVLEETIAKGTAGYKNRSKKTLDALTSLGY